MSLSLKLSYLMEDPAPFVPDLIPVSMIDVDRSPPMSMELPMSDACPSCGGHNMKVGDYVCWGFCYRCYEGASHE